MNTIMCNEVKYVLKHILHYENVILGFNYLDSIQLKNHLFQGHSTNGK